MKIKKNLILLFYILAGVIVGALIASFAQDVSFLSWLAYGKTMGIPTSDPMFLDLSIIKVAFGLEMGINVAQIITISLSIFCYKATVHKL